MSGWPSADEIAALGENHRRTVAGTLRTLEQRLRELTAKGLAELPEAELAALHGALAATGWPAPPLNVSSLLAALRVFADELEPQRLGGYGRLTPSQAETLRRLAGAVRGLLDSVRPGAAGRREAGEGAVSFRPVGVVRSPHREQAGTPIQPRFGRTARGAVEVAPEYAPALADLEGFERIWLICLLHRTRGWLPRVVPYRDDTPRGLFATRAPSRPNPVGISTVRLLGIDGPVLEVAELDLLDGTPVLDIKPYVPEFDAFPEAVAGWLEGSSDRRTADERFSDGSEGS